MSAREHMSMEDRIKDVISAFDAQGWHRTGTAVDAQSAEWLAGELERAGSHAGIESYRFRRLVPSDSFVEVAGQRIEGLPLFDSAPTPPEGVSGRFGDGEGAIRLLPATAAGHSREVDAARNSRALGIVIPTTAARPVLAPRNANDFRRPFGQPTLQVSGAALPALQEASAREEPVHLVSTFTFEDTLASNVIGVVAGTDLEAAPVCVMTPRSGWWNCASERGGGIACLLEIARSVVSARPLRTTIFVGTTGHELGHWGLEEFLLRRPGLERAAALWVHFGASVGAALEPRGAIYASRPELRDEALQFLKIAGATLPTPAPDGTVSGGESRNIHQAGGDYVSLVGGSAVFHLQEDRWPDAVDVRQVAAVAKGMTALTLRVANSNPAIGSPLR